MNLDDTISKRISSRKFKKKEPKFGDVIEAIDAALKIPLAGNIHNLKYIIIDDEKTKKLIAKHSQQLWISEAPVLIAVCSDETHIANLYHDRGKTYSRQHAGAAIQTLLLKLTDLGIQSCWVGAYADELIKQLLKIPQHINLEAIIPIGYSSEKPKSSPKGSLENSIKWNSWETSQKPTKFKEPRW